MPSSSVRMSASPSNSCGPIALSPLSPRVSVINTTRAPSLRLSFASTPPFSSSGWAVPWSTLAVVRIFWIFCHAPAAPVSCGSSCDCDDGNATTTTNRTAATAIARMAPPLLWLEDFDDEVADRLHFLEPVRDARGNHHHVALHQ